MRKLYIFGDSFAGPVVKYSWFKLVAEKLDMELICHGLGGASLFLAFKRLLDVKDQINDNDIVIFIEPSAERLYTGNNLTLDVREVTEKVRFPVAGQGHIDQLLNRDGLARLPNKHVLSYVQAYGEYYRYLYDEEYMVYMYWKIIEDLDKIKQSSKFQLFFSCDLFAVERNPTSFSPLMMLSRRQRKNLNEVNEEKARDFFHWAEDRKMMFNHFNEHNSKKIADIVANKLSGARRRVRLIDIDPIPVDELKNYFLIRSEAKKPLA